MADTTKLTLAWKEFERSLQPKQYIIPATPQNTKTIKMLTKQLAPKKETK